MAVLAWGGELGTGRADILDLAGHRIASFDAFDMAWVDDTHLMTLVVSPDDTSRGTVTVHSIDGTESDVVPGTFGAMFGNGHGSVALMAPVAASQGPATESFQIWSNGRLGARIAGPRAARAMVRGRTTAGPCRRERDRQPNSRGRQRDSGLARRGRADSGNPERAEAAREDGRPVASSRRHPNERVLLAGRHQAGHIRRPHAGSGRWPEHATDRQRRGLDRRRGAGRRWPGPAGFVVDAGRDNSGPKRLRMAVFGPNESDIATLPAADENLSAPVMAVVRRAGARYPFHSTPARARRPGRRAVSASSPRVRSMPQLVGNRLLRIEIPAS